MTNLKFWTNIGILNLTIVACLGVLMRYKIGFEFPYFDQKNLQHGHSHFAFSGWVTHILFVLMVDFLNKNAFRNVKFNNYKILISANLICAYGMLVSFAMQGYGAVSITFSSFSILINFIFAWNYFKDLNQTAYHPSKKWFGAALLFNLLSSAGTFFLAYMMSAKHIDQHAYLASVYFYLHFQYSGWFFFACIGLFMMELKLLPSFIENKKIFYYFFIACFPAYLLSVLWIKLPALLYVIVIGAVISQLIGMAYFIKIIKNNFISIVQNWSRPVNVVIGLAFMALIIKIILQAASTIPEISKLAFEFRPIVIAYLHLVLLAFTTLFLLGYLLHCGYIKKSKKAIHYILFFVSGVFLNELILMIQGITSIGYIIVPHLNIILFIITAFMLVNLILLLKSCLLDDKLSSL